MKKIAIVMGSGSDLPKLKPALDILNEFGAEFDVRIISAHRTPDIAFDFAKSAKANGYGVIVAAAGMAAHLAGVLAANTVLPVIGIPISGGLSGLDALLSTLQMPSGIPVATVAVDGAANAALLAIEILAVFDEGLSDKLAQYRQRLRQNALDKDAAINKREGK